MDSALVPTLFGALSTVAGVYALYLRTRINQLEKENAALEKENKTYVSLFLQLKGGDAVVLEKVLKKVAYLLRGGPDFELDE